MHGFELFDFHDAEEMSLALRHTNVSAMQISRGRFRAQFGVVPASDWTAQYIRFEDGAATCGGDGPPDRYAFIVPLKPRSDCRLLGRSIDGSSLGIYAPGSEHADISIAGLEQVVLMPPPHALTEFLHRNDASRLPVTGSHHASVSLVGLAQFRALLRSIMSSTGSSGTAAFREEVRRSLNDALATALSAVLQPERDESSRGRPPLPRSAIMRRLAEVLDAQSEEPAYASELARAVGVSDATLRRMFIELFGMPPARYLMTKRLYLARQRLRSRDYETVGQVAEVCGFWDQSRFAGRYKSLFGETPFETLRAGKRAVPAP